MHPLAGSGTRSMDTAEARGSILPMYAVVRYTLRNGIW